MHYYDIHPVNLIRSLSMALELAFTGMSKHHWRTAAICGELSARLSMSDADRQALIYAALLHDIGAASSWDERQRIKRVELLKAQEIYLHAEEGYRLLKDSPRFGHLARPIRHHHDLWSGGNPSGLRGDEIPLASRVIHLADRVEVLIDDGEMILFQQRSIIDQIAAKSGQDFDPALVEAFQAAGAVESFWLDLANPGYCATFWNGIDTSGTSRYSLDDFVQIAEIFATIIDRMSAFTATHSRSVAGMAVFLARLRGFSRDEMLCMQIAGLLHDIGKLAVPNEILEKPGKLTREEAMITRQHTYYTYQILAKIDHFKEIAKWAAYHHETLDGHGYPFHVPGDSLPLGARIVAVADVFVALIENRPYRKSLPEAQIRSIMTGMVKHNKIDGGVVGDLLERYDEAAGLMRQIERQYKLKCE